MRVAVFGAGYVGCVTATCLAGWGHDVWLSEISPEKLAILRAGKSPVFEPGLDDELGAHLRTGRIRPLAGVADALVATELCLVCLGTPGQDDGLPDLTQFRGLLTEIADALAGRPQPYTVVLRSTVPAPQLRQELLPLMEARLGSRFGQEVQFALNPEFLREGKALEDFRRPPFVVVGTEHPEAAQAVAAPSLTSWPSVRTTRRPRPRKASIS